MSNDWVRELPLVAAFVFFCLALLKLFLDFLKGRDNSWQKFMSEMRDQQDRVMNRLAGEIAELSKRFMEHDREMKTAIGVMKDRAKRSSGKTLIVSGDKTNRDEWSGEALSATARRK